MTAALLSPTEEGMDEKSDGMGLDKEGGPWKDGFLLPCGLFWTRWTTT